VEKPNSGGWAPGFKDCVAAELGSRSSVGCVHVRKLGLRRQTRYA
jgi:hypothetical protein